MIDQLTIVGLPITKESVTKRFTDFINQDKKVAVFTLGSLDTDCNDYIISTVGHKLILSSNKKVISLKLWYKNGKRRKPKLVVKDLLEELYIFQQNNPDYELAYMVPGSPFYGDSICPLLIEIIKDVTVINTQSSSLLTYNAISKYTKTNLNYNHCHFPLKSKSINVLSCLGPAYKISWLFTKLMLLSISKCDKLYTVYIGKENVITEITKDVFVELIKKRPEYMNRLTLVVVKNV